MARFDMLPSIIKKLYSRVAELEELFPDRHFTLDGHLVGSIGEVIAAHLYDLELLPSSTETHDAIAKDGRLVQVKATQRKMVGIGSEPDYLIVLKLHPDGSTSEIYNGPGKTAWNAAGPMQKNGHRAISVKKLESLMVGIDPDQSIRLTTN